MSDPSQQPGSRGRRGFNFTILQLVLFVGAGVVGLAALLAGGLALGLALAGAAMVAVLALVVWIVLANLAGARPPRT